MLRKMNAVEVISDDGRKMRTQFLNDYIAYIEGKKGLYIGCKTNIFDPNKFKTIVEVDAEKDFTGWMPNYQESYFITPQKRKEIIEFLEEAMKLLGYEFIVHNRPSV